MVFSRPVLNVCWVIRILWEVGVENADVKKSSLSVASEKKASASDSYTYALMGTGSFMPK